LGWTAEPPYHIEFDPMTLPKLRTQQPGQASVLIAGCSDDSTTLFSQAILSLGHRAFRWNDETSPPEIVTDSSWNIAICGPNLSESQLLNIADSASDVSQVLWANSSKIPITISQFAERLPTSENLEQASSLIHYVIQSSLLREERNDWRGRFTRQLFRDLVCNSEPMQKIQTQLLDEADRNTPLLLLGKPGADDRTVVWTLHQSSSRADSPCLTLDCESYSSTVFEQELFEYRDDSEGQVPPLLEQVDGGTLLLKNPDSLSQTTQKKLIRFLESPAISRPESHSLRYINIRWCFSFQGSSWPLRNSPLSLYLQERNDLQPVAIPALNARRDDLREIIRRSLAEHSIRLAQLPPILSAEAWQLLENYAWPRNEEQLQRVLSQITLLNNSSTVTAELISTWLESEHENIEPTTSLMSLAEMERQLIEATFNRFAGNREQTAQALGIGLRTLSGKLRQYGYPPRGGPGSNRRPTTHDEIDETTRRAA
jgi:DNA-binding NtrC family response regulator